MYIISTEMGSTVVPHRPAGGPPCKTHFICFTTCENIRCLRYRIVLRVDPRWHQISLSQRFYHSVHDNLGHLGLNEIHIPVITSSLPYGISECLSNLNGLQKNFMCGLLEALDSLELMSTYPFSAHRFNYEPCCVLLDPVDPAGSCERYWTPLTLCTVE